MIEEASCKPVTHKLVLRAACMQVIYIILYIHERIKEAAAVTYRQDIKEISFLWERAL